MHVEESRGAESQGEKSGGGGSGEYVDVHYVDVDCCYTYAGGTDVAPQTLTILAMNTTLTRWMRR